MATENNGILNPRENNKTNRERREQEAKQTKLLKTIGLAIGAVLVVLVIVGIIFGLTGEKNNALATIKGDGIDERITADEFKQAVSFNRANMISQYEYYSQIYAMFGMPMDESTTNNYRLQLGEDMKGLMGAEVLSQLVNQKVLAYGAAKEGITVTDEEVEAQYESMFAYYPNGEPTAKPTDLPFEPTPTVSDEQLAILRYTATPEPEAEPAEEAEAEEPVEEPVEEAVEVEEPVEEAVEAEEPVEEAVEAEVEEAAEAEEPVEEETVEEPVEESEPEPTVAPTEYTAEMFKMHQDVYFANNYYYSKDFFKSQLRSELLQEKVEDMLKEGLPREADMVWARHILVETEEEAQAVIDRFNAGEEWGDLAAELSTDTSNASNGGDLGWFAEGRMVAEFNDAAFAQEVGTISEAPVKTDFGYHVIQVIAHEVHPYTSSEYSDSVSQAYYEWLNKYEEELDVQVKTESIGKFTPMEPAFNH